MSGQRPRLEFKWVGRPKTTDKPRRSGDVVRQGTKAMLLINEKFVFRGQIWIPVFLLISDVTSCVLLTRRCTARSRILQWHRRASNPVSPLSSMGHEQII